MMVFGSVLYSAALQYIDEFIDSINSQIYRDFDMLIINDDINNDIINEYIKKINLHKVIVINCTQEMYTPAQLRVRLLLEAKKRGYNLIVSGDCDDTFAYNRTYQINEIYKKNRQCTFFYNNLVLKDGTIVFEQLPEKTESIRDIINYNYIGLSNSAIQLDKIEINWIKSLEECDSFVFDWYLFSRFLLDGFIGRYVEDTYTQYRIHNNNFAGVNKKNKDVISKELLVKKKHYRILSKYSTQISELYKKIENMTIDDVILNDGESSYWWSNVKIREDS